MSPGILLTVLMVVVLLLSACQGRAAPSSGAPSAEAASAASEKAPVQVPQRTPPLVDDVETVSDLPEADPPYGQTNIRLDGNRVAEGKGNLPELNPLDIKLVDRPVWAVGVPTESGAIWAAALPDGSMQAFSVTGSTVEEVPGYPIQLPSGMPPVLVMANDLPLLLAPDAPVSPATHAVLLHDGAGIAFVDTEGNLVVQQDGESTVLPVNALPDARVLVDEANRLLLLTGPTDRYGHGVLGDELEAAGITLVETVPAVRVVRTIQIPAPKVIEGLAPIWADLNDDGRREIIVTISDDNNGAQVTVYDEAGAIVGRGPAIGRGYRWRHQLAVAPFGADGEPELVDVLTPHIGGVVEFYRWEGPDLRIVAQQPGYTSHVIGTRNLDMAVAGDFDGDERMELLLPDQLRHELGAIQHTPQGAEVLWSLPAGGQIVTNLATVTMPDGQIGLGLGRADGTLRVWQP